MPNQEKWQTIFLHCVLNVLLKHLDVCPCAHHVFVQRRGLALLHKDWLDEQAHVVHLVPQESGQRQTVVRDFRKDYRHVDVAALVRRPLAVRAEQIDLRIGKAFRNRALVLPCKFYSLCLIHCLNAFVLSMMSLQTSSPRAFDRSSLYEG